MRLSDFKRALRGVAYPLGGLLRLCDCECDCECETERLRAIATVGRANCAWLCEGCVCETGFGGDCGSRGSWTGARRWWCSLGATWLNLPEGQAEIKD